MPPFLVLTIGQKPRLDLVAELGDVLTAYGFSTDDIEVQGALDGHAIAEIDELTPSSDADALHVHLPEAGDRVVSKTAISERLAPLVERAGTRPTIVACTGRFTALPNRPNLLFPSTVLDGLVDAVLPTGHRLGVLVPIPEQIKLFTEQRGRPDRPATVVSAKPGTDPTTAAEELRNAGVDLVVLDCFGYDRELLNTVRLVAGCPVLSSVRATAAVAAELVGGPGL